MLAQTSIGFGIASGNGQKALVNPVSYSRCRCKSARSFTVRVTGEKLVKSSCSAAVWIIFRQLYTTPAQSCPLLLACSYGEKHSS